MKPTTPSFKTLTALMIAIAAALVTQPMRAVPIVNNIVITENSNTSLSATYNGSSAGVFMNRPDAWSVTFPTSVVFNAAFDAWIEDAASYNLVNYGGAGSGGNTNQLFVTSDKAGVGLQANGSTSFNVGTDSANGLPIDVTFFDKGDVATAPDTGTTASLFGLSLTGLAFLRRKLS